MGKGKREVVIGILTFQLFENINFIFRQEHKILSDHTKISILGIAKRKRRRKR